MHATPDWEGFRALLAVVESGSFSSAARGLGISQPTASRRIAQLESALGARLLVRRSRGVVATPAGERVLAQVRRMAEGATAAVRIASGDASRLGRPVRITATEGLGTLWLPPRIAALRAEVPGLRVEVLVDNAAADLAARQADIAIRLFRPRQPDLVARKVGSLGFGFFAAPAYLAARGVPRRLADLARHDHVGFIERGLVMPAYVRWLRRMVPEERFVVSASSVPSMIELARAGSGILLGTLVLLVPDRTLVRLLPKARPAPLDIWLAAHVDVRRDPEVVRVLAALDAMFAREAAALAG